MVVKIVYASHPVTFPLSLISSVKYICHSEWRWYIIMNWRPYFIQISLDFTQCSFSAPGSHSGYHTTFSYYISLGFSWLWWFLWLSLFFDDLDDSFEKYWSSILQYIPQLRSIWCFPGNKTGLIGFGDEHNKVSFSLHHIKGTYYQHDLSLLMLTLSPRWLFLVFLQCKITLPPFSIPYFVEGSC